MKLEYPLWTAAKIPYFGPIEKPEDALPFYRRWMPKLSFRGYHAFNDYIGSPFWNKLVVPFYRWTTSPVINAVYNTLGLNPIANSTVNATADL